MEEADADQARRREIIFARQVERPHRFGNEVGIAHRDRRVRAGAEREGGRQRVEIRAANVARDAGADEEAVGGFEHEVEARQQEVVRAFGDGLPRDLAVRDIVAGRGQAGVQPAHARVAAHRHAGDLALHIRLKIGGIRRFLDLEKAREGFGRRHQRRDGRPLRRGGVARVDRGVECVEHFRRIVERQPAVDQQKIGEIEPAPVGRVEVARPRDQYVRKQVARRPVPCAGRVGQADIS